MALVATSVFCLPTIVRAAVTDSKYTVQGVSPNGTTIDLFDYWTTNTETPSEDDNYNYNGGINNGHQLKFNTGTPRNASDVINSWTGAGNGPRTGIVENSLVEGYPSIKAGTISGWVNLDNNNNGRGGTQALTDESLAYLFDNSSQAGKQGYYDVQGLLQVDSDGYYYYNASSKQTKDQGGSFESANYAAFDSNANAFTLYNTWGVMHEGTNSPDGQFFPFNSAADVFTENGQSSALVQRNIKASSNDLNHYFGMHMSTQFVQQYGGHVDDAEDADAVTYEFSGDDDVWIYIDDVLVGDLGGIHDAARITIDFSTGKIKVTDSKGSDVTPDGMKTLSDCYKKAGVAGDYKWSGDTFADDTYHTLDFFYLERGNNDSNMSLRYNLVSIPETELSKVDQEGNFIDGATFNVYDTTDGKEISPDSLICEGVETEADGTVTLIGQDDYPITLDQLWDDGVKNITLVETDTPDGYRASTEIPLYIQHYNAEQTANQKETNLLLSSDPWTTGAYAQPKVTATTTSDVQIDRQNNSTLSKDELQSGVLFAVIEQKGGDGQWYPVTGDALNGWNVSEGNAMSDIIAAGLSTNAVFTISTSGAYQTEIENLPGQIQQYQFFAGEDAVYRGAYYYTTASTLAGATEDNTYTVTNSDTFDRQFSARIYLSNILNRVLVQKTDEDGNAVDGATMSLFSSSQVDVAEDGSVALKEGVTAEDAIQTDVTHTLSKESGDSIDLDGAVIFTNLESGTYYAVETAAPSGYVLNQYFAKIIVDNTGVYADAGTDDDGISVTRGVGRIVRSMVQFATADDIDATLHYIVATPQLGTQKADGAWEWAPNTSASAQHLQFADDGDAVLDYKMTSGEAYTVETGVPGLSIAQCDEHKSSPRQEIDDDITSLFTGVAIVHIKDQQVGALDVTKTVTGEGADQDSKFDFTVTFAHPAVEGQEAATALTQDEATAAGMQLTIDNGQAADVIVGENGTITFQLKAGQTAHFTNIPAGVTYQVTEKPAANFTTAYDDSQAGTITFNATASTTVTNTWEPSAKLDGATNLVVAKNVAGTDWDDDWSFDFMIAPYGEDTEKAVESGTVTMPDPVSVSIGADDVNDDGVHQKAFGDITFNAEGTYQFVVTENAFSIDGLAKDESQKVVTVSVAPNQMTGQLEATLVTTGDDASDALVFTNTANLTFDATHTFKVIKELKSQYANLVNADEGAYGFTITAQDSVVDGVTSSTAAEAAAKISIENGVSTTFNSDKLDFAGNNTWSATMYPIEDGITFTADDRGKTFTWTISENKPDQVPAGYVYDESVHTLSITVSSDTSAALSLDITLDGEPVADNAVPTVTFTNRVDVIDAEIPVTKTTNVATDKTFTFDVKLDSAKNTDDNDITDGVWMLKDNALAAFSADGESFDIAMGGRATASGSFKNLVFAQPGTYIFSVKESVPEDTQGWTYDSQEFTYIFTVECNDAGFLTSQGSIKDAQQIGFNNSYKATTGDSGVAVSATKSLTGRDLQADEFSFAIAPRTANSLLDPVATAKNAADGTVDFGNLRYTTADEDTSALTSLPQAVNAGYATEGVNADGQRMWTLSYTAYEVTDGLSSVGVSANKSSFDFTVAVVDKGDGTLTATADLPQGGIAFTNTYSTGDESVSVTPSGSKSFVYADGKAANPDFEGRFTFTLSSDDPTAPMPADGGATATNDASGNVTFGAISFDLEDLNGVETAADGSRSKTFTYTVAESGSVDSVTNDATAIRTFTITLMDNGQGRLTAVADPASGPMFVFTNTYTPASTTATIEATKVLKGAELTAGRFTFELTGSEDAPMPENTRVTNDENGKVTFGPITSTTVGEYDYAITEVNDHQNGVSYDENSSRTVHVSVKDDGNGQLVATVTSGGDDLKFTNTYTPPTTPPGEHEPENPNTPEPEEPETPTTPEEPTTPETPETPETPVTPENPSTPSTPEQPVKPEQPTETLPSTGDAMLGAVIATAAIGVACLGAAHVIRKRGEQ